MTAEVGVMCFEDGGRGHKSRNTGMPPVDAAKDKETDSPLTPPAGLSPADTLTLAQ